MPSLAKEAKILGACVGELKKSSKMKAQEVSAS